MDNAATQSFPVGWPVGVCGIRLEDHFYMTQDGPAWFTQPAYSIDDPFGYQSSPP